jgi:hypothetical protein
MQCYKSLISCFMSPAAEDADDNAAMLFGFKYLLGCRYLGINDVRRRLSDGCLRWLVTVVLADPIGDFVEMLVILVPAEIAIRLDPRNSFADSTVNRLNIGGAAVDRDVAGDRRHDRAAKAFWPADFAEVSLNAAARLIASPAWLVCPFRS